MRLLHRFTLTGFAAVAALAWMPTAAHASTIYYLDCEITGSNTCIGTSTAGTITLTDTGLGIEVTIAAGSPAAKVDEFDFNTDLTDGTWTASGGDAGAVTAPGTPDGYGANFDYELGISPSGPTNLPQTFTLLNSAHDLSISNVAQLDSLGQLYFAVHLSGFPGGCSEWLGSQGTTNPGRTSPTPSCGDTGGGGSTGGGGATIPEPVSMLLFGAGAMATAYRARRRAAR